MQAILTAVGYAAGAAVGMPALGGLLGSTLGGMLAAGQQEITGPRVGDMKAPQVQYGSKLVRLYGANRTAGVMAWYSDKRQLEHSEGGGCFSPDVTTFTSEIDVLYILSIDSDVIAVTRVWRNGELAWTEHDDSDGTSLEVSQTTGVWTSMTFLDGNPAQLPHPVIEASEGVGNAPAYRHRQCVLLEGLQLGQSGQMPLMEFECITAGTSVTGTALYAPLTTNGNDTISPVATLTVQQSGAISYGAGGAAMDCSLASGSDIELQYTHATKLDLNHASFDGRDVTLSVTCEFIASGTGGGTGNHCQFLIYAGGAQQASWDVRMVSGELHICSRWNDGTGPVIVDHGTGAVGNFKLVWNAAGTELSFYNGADLLRTVTAARMTGAVFVRAVYTAPNGSGVTLYGFKDVRLYSGAGGTTWAPGTVDLADIVSAEWARVDDVAHIDVSDLVGIPVRGFQTSGSVRAALESLASIFHFGAVCSDKLYFRRLGGASVATIPYGDLAAGVDQSAEQPFAPERGNPEEILERAVLTYPNYSDDYANGTETGNRAVTESKIVTTIQTNVVMIPAEAKAAAETIAAQAGIAATTAQITLSDYYAPLEPTDPITVPDEEGTLHRMRIKRTTYGGGVTQADLERDDITALVAPGITSNDYQQSLTVTPPGVAEILPFESPIFRDADDGPGIYVASKGHKHVATIYSSTDDVTFSSVATITEQAVFGKATSTLGNWTGGNDVDEVNSLTVDLGSDGTLTSSTFDAMIADRTINLMLVGSEVVRPIVCTLVSPGVYTLTRFFRAHLGTESFKSTHAANEDVVLLRAAGIRRITHQLSDIGAVRYYKAVSAGRTVSSASSQSFTDTGISLKPYAPVDLEGSRNSSGDVTLTCHRRSRFSSVFLGGDPPLGETSEAYSIDIYADATFATVKRTLPATSTTAVYPYAQQIADFGSLPTQLSCKWYQLSATIGRGYPGQRSIDVPVMGPISTATAFAASYITAAPARAGNRAVIFYRFGGNPNDASFAPPRPQAFFIEVHQLGLTFGATDIYHFAARRSLYAEVANPITYINDSLADLGTDAGNPSDHGVTYLAGLAGVDVSAFIDDGSGTYPSDWCENFNSAPEYNHCIVFPTGQRAVHHQLAYPSAASYGEHEVTLYTVPDYPTAPTVLVHLRAGTGFEEYLAADRAQVSYFDFAGTVAPGSTFRITLNSTNYDVVAGGGDTLATITTALAALVDAEANFIGTTLGPTRVVVTAVAANTPFTFSSNVF